MTYFTDAAEDFTLTETEYADADVAELRAELDEEDAREAAYEEWADEQARAYASILWNER